MDKVAPLERIGVRSQESARVLGGAQEVGGLLQGGVVVIRDEHRSAPPGNDLDDSAIVVDLFGACADSSMVR